MVMEPSTYLGKYQIESVLGRGSMGVVYRARDRDLGHSVAIKTLRKEALEDCNDGSLLQRFKNEALAGRRLKHRSIVSIYDYGETGDIYYLVMELVQGKQLRDYFKENYRFTTAETARLMRQLLDALDYAHRNGVVHRDINPNNLLLTETGDLMVMDFGIAKIDGSRVTRTGMVLGTPAHMSPEQCLGQPVDHRSDIFSAATILYQMVTGKRPFDGNSALSTMQQIINRTPAMPSQLTGQTSAALDRVLSKGLAKRPEDRFGNAARFADALFSAFEVTSPTKPPAPAPLPEMLFPQQSGLRSARRDGALGELAAAIFGGFGAVALLWYMVYSTAPLLRALNPMFGWAPAAGTHRELSQVQLDLTQALSTLPSDSPVNRVHNVAKPVQKASAP